MRDEMRLGAAIDQWAARHRDELIQDLMGLIRIPSIVDYHQDGLPMGRECKRALDFFLCVGKKYGFEIENGEDHWGSLLHRGSEGGKELGILGHLDVVAAGEGWQTDPFQPVERRGYIIGRGSYDNKGPLIMSLYVLRCLKEMEIPLRSNLRLIAGCDEEREMRDVAHFLNAHKAPSFSLNCDGAWPMCIGEKGILVLEIILPIHDESLVKVTGGNAENNVPDAASAVVNQGHDIINIHIRGVGTHCSTPSAGNNAIRQLIARLCRESSLQKNTQERLRRLYDCIRDDDGSGLRISYEDRLSGKTTCVPTLISYEQDKLHIRLNIRYALSQNAEVMIKHISDRCTKCDMQCKILSYHPPRYDSPDQPIHKRLLATYREVLNGREKPYIMGGGTHSRMFSHSVPYGPLSMSKTSFGHPHGANEAVSIDQLLKAIKVYVIALKRLDLYFHQPSM